MNTGANEDIIFPGIGGDDINGGPGSDLVSYVVRPQSAASHPRQWNCVQRVK